MLRLRLLSAVVAIPLLILVVVEGGPVYDGVLALVLFAAVAEFMHAAGGSLRRPLFWLPSLLAGGLPLAVRGGLAWPVGLLAAYVVVSLAAVVLTGATEPGLGGWLLGTAVAVYAGWLGMHLGLLRQLDHGRAWVLLALLTTFACDTGAYAVGHLLGRHPLAPRISPKKTIEGAVGGLVGATLSAPLLNHLLGPSRPPLRLLLIGIAVGIVAQIGDLAESALKRSLEIKDAGRLVPGHGGLLDRLDSLLVVGAVLYYLVRWISP